MNRDVQRISEEEVRAAGKRMSKKVDFSDDRRGGMEEVSRSDVCGL